MIHQFKKNKTCSNPIECSDNIITELENKFTCKLKALNKKDSVHGSVSILHTPNNHDIRIEFYDNDQKPNAEHETTLKKLGKIPSQSEIKKII